jgi:hypothetical protein
MTAARGRRSLAMMGSVPIKGNALQLLGRPKIRIQAGI